MTPATRMPILGESDDLLGESDDVSASLKSVTIGVIIHSSPV